MSESVAIVKTEGLETDLMQKSVKRALDLLGNPIKKIGPDSKVVIKPNICMDNVRWETGVLTNPSVVRAIVEEVKKQHPKEIIIAEASSVGVDTEDGFKFLGYDKIAEETGATLVDLNKTEFVNVPVKNGQIHESISVAKEILSADYTIVVPVMKTHVATGISVCMKCLKGVISDIQKKKSHYFGLAQSIVELNMIVKPDLFIVDGSIAGEGDGPIANTPVNLGLIIAGFDARATDVVAAGIMGFDFRDISFLKISEDYLGPINLDYIQILGDEVDVLPFTRAADELSLWDNVEIINGQACSHCKGCVQLALSRIKEMGILAKASDIKIMIGPEAIEPLSDKNLFIIGNCLDRCKDKGNHVPGCPPQVFLITDEIREKFGEIRLSGEKESFRF